MTAVVFLISLLGIPAGAVWLDRANLTQQAKGACTVLILSFIIAGAFQLGVAQ